MTERGWSYLAQSQRRIRFRLTSWLFRVDHDWNVMEDHIVRGPRPTAAESKIGYLLSGAVFTTNQWSEHRSYTSRLNSTSNVSWIWNQKASHLSKPLMKILPFCVTTRILPSIWWRRITVPYYHWHKYGFTTDIGKAFMSVFIKETEMLLPVEWPWWSHEYPPSSSFKVVTFGA